MATRKTSISRKACTICRSPHRHEIERGRLAGVSLDVLAEKYGCHRSSLWRHMARHVDEETKAAYLADIPLRELAERATAESLSLLDYLALIRGQLISQMMIAASVNDGARVATLAGRARETLETIARLTGELRGIAPGGSTSVNIAFMQSPIYASLEGMLLDRLSPYPDALRAVVDGLRELEGQTVENTINGTARELTVLSSGGFDAHAV